VLQFLLEVSLKLSGDVVVRTRDVVDGRA